MALAGKIFILHRAASY